MNRGPTCPLKQPIWQERTTGRLTPNKMYLDDGIDSTVCPFFLHHLLKALHQHFHHDHWSQLMALTKQTPATLFVLKNADYTTCLGLFITWPDPRKWNVDRKVMWFRAQYNLQQNNVEIVLWNLVYHLCSKTFQHPKILSFRIFVSIKLLLNSKQRKSCRAVHNVLFIHFFSRAQSHLTNVSLVSFIIVFLFNFKMFSFQNCSRVKEQRINTI